MGRRVSSEVLSLDTPDEIRDFLWQEGQRLEALYPCPTGPTPGQIRTSYGRYYELIILGLSAVGLLMIGGGGARDAAM